jgi:phosphoadenosine phosphosulfate reductase
LGQTELKEAYMKDKVEEYLRLTEGKDPLEILKLFADLYPGGMALSSSLGAEDQILTEMISKVGDKHIRVFTLDTGRLFPESYELIQKTETAFPVKLEVYFPDKEKVEKMVLEKGINLFYDSQENRKLCCNIRKVEPLSRALLGVKVWITGIRKDQTVSRFFNKMVEWDEDYGIIKLNPLLNWTEKDVWNYIKENNIPYNSLHDKGFTSIGCQPCTRAIKPGEDLRAGRWWWEQTEQKECGLHVKKS